MKSENSGTIHSSQINVQLQTAGQQSGTGAAVPKTLVMLLTKHMYESTLSLSRSACVVIRLVRGCRRTCVPVISHCIASHSITLSRVHVPCCEHLTASPSGTAELLKHVL